MTSLRKRLFPVIWIVLLLAAGLFVCGGTASATPPLPQLFSGQVTVAGQPAGSGATITAKINGTQAALPCTTDAQGRYSLNVQAPDAGSYTIEFYINGVKADQTAPFSSGAITTLNLNAATAGSPASPLSITTTGLPQATVGTAYSQTLQATGGTPPYSWSKTSGSLPPGLNISGASISGTPTAADTYSFGIQVTDGASQVASASLSITVNAVSTPSALSVTSSGLSAGTVGSSYSANLSAAGGTPSYSWTLLSGSLPPGLNLYSSGAISGTPTAASTFSFTVRVSDSASQSNSATCSITINPAPSTPPPTTPSSQPGTPAGTTPASSPSSTPSSSSSTPASSTGTASGQASATPASAATFSMSDLATSVGSGGKVNISIRVANNGSVQGRKTLVLKVDDEGVAQQDVVLEPGESKVIDFAVNIPEPGTYKAGIDALSTSFDVKGPASTAGGSQTYPETPVMVWVILAGGVLAILVLLVLIVRKYRS